MYAIDKKNHMGVFKKQTFTGMVRDAISSFAADLKRNPGNVKMLIALFSFRMAHVASLHRKSCRIANVYAIPVILGHRFLTEWLFGMELPAATEIGPGLVIDHGYALVINKNTTIGKNCRTRHCVTIGCKINVDETQGASPRIGDRVDIGAGAIIVGNITIGNDVVIGAGAVVTQDVPANVMVVGNPARIIERQVHGINGVNLTQ